MQFPGKLREIAVTKNQIQQFQSKIDRLLERFARTCCHSTLPELLQITVKCVLEKPPVYV